MGEIFTGFTFEPQQRAMAAKLGVEFGNCFSEGVSFAWLFSVPMRFSVAVSAFAFLPKLAGS
jgi:hypothetical protein